MAPPFNGSAIRRAMSRRHGSGEIGALSVCFQYVSAWIEAHAAAVVCGC